MKIRITFEFDERVRRAISHNVGRPKPASYDECRAWLDKVVNSTIESIVSELDEAEEEKE